MQMRGKGASAGLANYFTSHTVDMDTIRLYLECSIIFRAYMYPDLETTLNLHYVIK